MFATREPNFKRRLAGHVGGVLGATAMLIAVLPGIATAAPALNKLTLASVCTLPGGDAVMRVGNTNAVDVAYTWDIAKTSITGKGVASPGESYVLFPPSTAGNTRLFVDGKQQAAKAQNPDVCVAHVQVSKLWVDAKGAPIASPAVPKGWALTLRSDLETVTCTWNKAAGAVKCSSKVDAEDKGGFANVGASLEVPVGGAYTIDETATPGFDRSGLGKFGVEMPTDLAAFFGGGDTLAAVVTNTAVAPVVTTTSTTSTTSTTLGSTSTAAPTTTIESPTTTLAPPEETTTTTSVEEPTTTTEVEEPTTTTEVDEETTTTTTEVDEETTTTTTESPSTTVAAAEETTTTTSESPSTTVAAAEETTTTTSSVEESTTTVAPATSGPAGVRGLALDPPSGEGQPDPATQVLAGTDGPDVLPVTGAASVPIAVLGLGLVAIGTCISLAARRRLDV
jgi:hypothetical protein